MVPKVLAHGSKVLGVGRLQEFDSYYSYDYTIVYGKGERIFAKFIKVNNEIN